MWPQEKHGPSLGPVFHPYMEARWLDVYTAPCCFRAHTSSLPQSLLETEALSGVQVPATNQLSVNLCPLVSLDASARISRCQGDGEMVSEKRSPTQPNEARELASFPCFSWDTHCAGCRDSTVF